MTRVKRGTIANKRRKKVLTYTKGFQYGRKNKFRQAKEALLHAWTHSYRDRKRKKREARQLWTVKLNAVARDNGINYSKLIKLLKDKNIKLDRKVLAQLAEENPEIMQAIIKLVQS